MEEYILWLDVSMNNIFFVQILQSAADLFYIFSGHLLLQRFLFYQGVQISVQARLQQQIHILGV